MKTFSKKLLALALSVVLALPTVFVMPFASNAATVSEASPVKYGLVRTGDQDRGSGNNGCITNDGGDNNMSAILWEFDLSAIKEGYEVDSATLTEDIWSINNRNIPNQYLDFWYCNPADMSNYSNYLNNGNYRDTSLGYGTTGPSTYKAAFGITESTPLYSSQHVYENDSATLSFSNQALIDALNKAADENWGSIVFVAMFNEPAATTWSDIWAGFPKLSYTTKAVESATFAKAKMAAYDGSNLSSTSSGGIQFSGGGNAYTENVLFTANGNYDSNYFDGVLNGNNKIGFNIYPASSRVVYLSDGDDTVVGYPLIVKVQKTQATATTVHFGVNYIAIDNAENWRLTDDWFVCSGDRVWDNTYDFQTDKAYGVNKINYDPVIPGHGNENIIAGSWGSHSEGHFTENSPITLANAMYFDSAEIDFGDDYYYAIPALPTFKASVDGCAHWIGSQGYWNNVENWSSITINGKTDIDLRVLNIKPLKDIVSSADFKSNFNSIVENEWMYTAESLANYYDAVAAILRFNVNELDVSNDGALASSANEIKELVDNYNTYKIPVIRTFTVDFKTADGNTTIESRTVTAGDELGELPENSTPTHIDGTNTHNAFSWVGVTAQTVVTDDATYTETASTENCSFTAGAHTEATEQLNGYTTFECACNDSYIEYDPQDWNSYDNIISAYNEILGASDYASKYTAASRSAYESAVESARLDATDETLSPTAISNAVDAISNAQNLLETVADFSTLRSAYTRANELLLSLDSKAGIYTEASLQALVDAAGEPDIATYLNASDISIYGNADEQRANELAQAIDNAYNSLEATISGVDTSSYVVAAQTINTLDPDVYSNTSSIGSATRISGKLIKTTDIAYTDVTNSENTAAIKALPDTATQQNLDDATRTILDALYISVVEYTITTNDAVTETSFQNGRTSGDSSPYTATYGSNVIAHSEDSDTAWYMDFDSDSTSRSRQYQGFGETFVTKVVANINIYAEKRSTASPNMVKIYRAYSDNPQARPIQAVSYDDSSYELPVAPALIYYSFSGYCVNGDTANLISEGETINISGDTEIDAVYTFNGSADCAINATALENGTGFNNSVAYNTKIELNGGDNAYAWVEAIDANHYRPFAIGSDITFYATESTELFAVTEEQFNAYGFTLPTINLRKSGTITGGTKVIFNGQIVESGSIIREYGVVIGINKTGSGILPEDVIVDNSGTHADYDVIRAKSTKLVGANQFSISINGLAGKDYIYKGYVVYEKTNGEFVTVYTDAMM